MTWTTPPSDRPDGPLTGPERPMLEAFVAWQRSTLLHKCAGLTPTQLAHRSDPPSRMSLLGLIRHMAKVERTWFRERVAGQAFEPMYEPDADFRDIDVQRAQDDYARLIDEQRLADEAIAGIDLDHSFELRGEKHSLRLVYLHMIEEYARHNGHADLLREHIDGAIGE